MILHILCNARIALFDLSNLLVISSCEWSEPFMLVPRYVICFLIGMCSCLPRLSVLSIVLVFLREPLPWNWKMIAFFQKHLVIISLCVWSQSKINYLSCLNYLSYLNYVNWWINELVSSNSFAELAPNGKVIQKMNYLS